MYRFRHAGEMLGQPVSPGFQMCAVRPFIRCQQPVSGGGGNSVPCMKMSAQPTEGVTDIIFSLGCNVYGVFKHRTGMLRSAPSCILRN